MHPPSPLAIVRPDPLPSINLFSAANLRADLRLPEQGCEDVPFVLEKMKREWFFMQNVNAKS